MIVHDRPKFHWIALVLEEHQYLGEIELQMVNAREMLLRASAAMEAFEEGPDVDGGLEEIATVSARWIAMRSLYVIVADPHVQAELPDLRAAWDVAKQLISPREADNMLRDGLRDDTRNAIVALHGAWAPVRNAAQVALDRVRSPSPTLSAQKA